MQMRSADAEFITKVAASVAIETRYENDLRWTGSSWKHGFAESFHSRLRDDLLRVTEFNNLSHAERTVQIGEKIKATLAFTVLWTG
jgi:hypothetical protein